MLGLGAAALAPLAALAWTRPAAGQQSGDNESALRGTQRSGTITPIPIAIPHFLGEDSRFVTELTAVITADLERSGCSGRWTPLPSSSRCATSTPRRVSRTGG